jgi:hypothetical protein
MEDDHCCKVSSTIQEYELTPPDSYTGDMNDYIVDKWEGKNDNKPVGYRKLAEWINKRILRKVYVWNDRSATDIRIDSEYDYLSVTDDSVDSEKQRELFDDLIMDGIDIETVKQDFVSKSTVSRHIRDHLGAKKESKEPDTDLPHCTEVR